MLVQTVAQQFGEAYCEGCRRMRPCITLTLRCDERDATVHHAFCQGCIAEGIGFEVTLPDPMVKQGLARRRRTSRRGERATAREVGGRTTANSGATHGDGDVITPDWMIEEKQTSARSYRLSVNVLQDAMGKAQKLKRDWLIRLRMPDKFDLAVLDWRVLRGIVRDHERDTAT